MDVQKAYDLWSQQYDTNENLTRDLEGKAFRQVLEEIPFAKCLEIGCGTGKNTEWLSKKARSVTAVDLSAEMLEVAKAKIKGTNVQFVQSDVNADWHFSSGDHDLVSFSLVLEHIADLDSIFTKAAAALRSGGYMYMGELHPFKQYAGSKARFEMHGETVILDCFTHHTSEYLQSAKRQGFQLHDFREYFDEVGEIPRLIVMVFRKASST